MGVLRERHFVMAGAGLGGALLAAELGRAGHRVDVYERRNDPRKTLRKEGKSINLAISERGFHALGRVGLKERVLEMAVPMSGRFMHDHRGRTVYQPYGIRPEETIKSVSRSDLNRVLIERAASQPGVAFHFEHRCLGADLEAPSLTVRNLRTGEKSTASGDAVIGADGAFSAVRRSMQRLDRFDESRSFLRQSYKELEIPPGPGGRHRLRPNVLHIWPRGGYMMIALPNLDGSFTVTLFWPAEGQNSFGDLRTEEELLSFFRDRFPDAVDVMPNLAEDYFRNPVGSLVTVRCNPWHHRGKVVLLGDACHAVVPFYGQGANAAFEDSAVLMECLQAGADDLEEAFSAYSTARKEHADALADLAIANFNVMSERVMSRGFLLRKRFERLLHRCMPRSFLPLYTMISFTRIPYGDALRRSKRQETAVRAGLALLLFGLVFSLILLAGYCS